MSASRKAAKEKVVVKPAKTRQEIEKLITTLPDNFSALGLDLSYSCSGLVYIDNKVTTWDTIQPKNALGIGRLASIQQKLTHMIVEYRPSVIYMEDYARNSRNWREEMGEVGGIARLVCWQFQIPTYAVSPTSVKLFMTGSGRADKDMMVANCQLVPSMKAAGRSKATIEGVADAFGVALCGIALAVDPDCTIKFRQIF